MRDSLKMLEKLLRDLDVFIERWAKIQNRSIRSIQIVSNNLLQLEHLNGDLGIFNDNEEIRQRAKDKLYIVLFDKLIPQLQASVREFSTLMRMTVAMRNTLSILVNFVESLRSLVEFDRSLENILGYYDIILDNVEKVLDMFETEYETKIVIYDELKNGELDLQIITNYLTIWTVEPNIEVDTLEKSIRDLEENYEILRASYGKDRIKSSSVSYMHE